MSKIELKNIFLLNWYGFVKKVVPIDKDLTFITGENESGKSTILDAFKYAFLGDTEFNKSSGTAKRNLRSYTRCLIDPTRETYARPADQFPTVYTHIALEFHDALNNNSFILGVIIETTSSNDTPSKRYIIENKTLNDISFTYMKDGYEIPYSSRLFSKKYNVDLYNVDEGIIKFMAKVNFRFDKPSFNSYKRRLRNLMTYKAESRIPEFMKKFVLEEKSIKLDKLRDSKRNIEKLNNDLSGIREEMVKLNDIIDKFKEREKVKERLDQDHIISIYKDKLISENHLQQIEDSLKKNNIRLEELKQLIPALKIEKENADNQYLKIKTKLESVDAVQAIQLEKELLNKLISTSVLLKDRLEKLYRFQEIIHSILSNQVCNDYDSNEIINNLCSHSYTSADKEFEVNRLKQFLENKNNVFNQQLGVIKNDKNLYSNQIREIEVKLDNLKKNRIDYSFKKEQQSLINEILKEYRKQGIDSEVKMACEYVLEINDVKWQQAIEAFLGPHRYAIIVEPQYFDIANRVMDYSTSRYVELVRTKSLLTRNIEIVEDSVLNKLEITNEIAKKYFAYFLGRIHAVEKNQVDAFDNAMSKEGKLSRNMSVSYMNFKKLKEYSLGQHAIKLNIDYLTKEKEELIAKEVDSEKRIRLLNQDIQWIKNQLEHFVTYDYDAKKKYDENNQAIDHSQKNVSDLEDALSNNQEYITLLELEDTKKKERDKKEKAYHNAMNERTGISKQNNELEYNRIETISSIDEIIHQLEEEKEKKPRLVTETIELCSKYTYQSISSIMRKEETIAKSRSRYNTLESEISYEQKEYNSSKRPEDMLPIGLNFGGKYSERLNRIKIDNLERVQLKLKEQTNKYNDIFKNDFCTRILAYTEDALSDIRSINRELRKLSFTTGYRFDIKKVDDGSDYAKILKYAEYLKQNPDTNQLILEDISGYTNDEIDQLEKEIQSIINRICSKDDRDDELIKFADYRNYLDYEIRITNEDVNEGRLSKQIGYDSGAATQIPYLLILAASLSIFYNSRDNCSRLIFIDEPFEKMSDKNIKEMLDFFKRQNFQVILCAPSNKMDSIGVECNTIVPVIKCSKDQMIIGVVQFNGN